MNPKNLRSPENLNIPRNPWKSCNPTHGPMGQHKCNYLGILRHPSESLSLRNESQGLWELLAMPSSPEERLGIRSNPKDPKESSGSLWIKEFFGILNNPEESCGILRNPYESLRIHRNPKESFGILRTPSESLGLLRRPPEQTLKDFYSDSN